MPRQDRPDSIGERLRRLRSERGMTQETLAQRAAVSVDLVKKLEQGTRESARLTTLVALADALDVPMSELTDKRPRLDGGGDRLVLALRDALLSPDLLMVDAADEGPAPLVELTAAVERSWAHYWAGRFVDLARALPALIGEARHAHRHLGPPAARVLAEAYEIAACLLVHLGREDLAAVGAERGIAVAAQGDDELLWAVLHGSYAWALIGQARPAEAEQVAIRAAQRVEPRFTTAAPAQLTVWGGLVLWAMAGAVEGNRPDLAQEYISLSRVAAARMDRDRHDYQVNFGPTQVAMQTTYAHAVAGRPDQALAAARGVRREDLRTISYGRHLLDVAQAHADSRRDDDAVGVLRQAKDLAPVWFRHQVVARSLVTDIRERRALPSPALRDLVRSLNTPH
jgi:transcriptional regulator with XRE-family HTH domain